MVGIDGAYNTASFLGNKNLVITALASKSFDRRNSNNCSYAWRFSIEYPNDLINNIISLSSIQNNYNPELGFLERRNFDNFSWKLQLAPRWFTRYDIRTMTFKPWGFRLYRTNTTGELESFYNETIPFGFLTKNGDSFAYTLQQEFERFDVPFALTNSIKIPVGRYTWMVHFPFRCAPGINRGPLKPKAFTI